MAAPSAKPNSTYHTVTKTSVLDARMREERFANYRKQWLESPKTFTVTPFPTHIDLESTGVCNLRCPFCGTTTEKWGPTKAGYMKMDLFKKVIDEGEREGLCSIKLSFRGEPTIHPNLIEMMKYAKAHGVIDMYFNTNATLVDEKTFNKYIDAGLDRISISFEGTTKEVYEKNRVGATFEKVLENVRRMKTIREKRGVKHPEIRMQTVLLPELADKFQSYVDFWLPYVDEVGFIDPRLEGSLHDHRGMSADWACPYLWQRVIVLWDGSILPCLMHGVDDFASMTLGDANKVSIKDAWHGKRF